MKYKICKECWIEYRGKEYFQHMHGKNHPSYGMIRTDTTREKMSLIHKGKILSKEHKQAIFNSRIGTRHSIESRKKMSIARMGHEVSIATRRKIKNNWMNGRYENARSGRGKSGFRNDVGHTCRSTWEANFARILNYLNIYYEYEPRRFDLRNGSYLPDFRVGNTYVEIKGYDTVIAKQKRVKCREKYGVRILVIKRKRYNKLRNRYNHLIPNWEY